MKLLLLLILTISTPVFADKCWKGEKIKITESNHCYGKKVTFKQNGKMIDAVISSYCGPCADPEKQNFSFHKGLKTMSQGSGAFGDSKLQLTKVKDSYKLFWKEACMIKNFEITLEICN